MNPDQIALANQLLKDATSMSTFNLLAKIQELGQGTSGLNAIALFQGAKKKTFLHHLVERGREEVIAEYIKHLDSATLDRLINTLDSSKQNPLDYLLKHLSTDAVLKPILNKASEQSCSRMLISGRPVSILERLFSEELKCSNDVKKLILKTVNDNDLNTVFNETDILGSICEQFAEVIARIDLQLLQKKLTAHSQIKSSPVFGNPGEADLQRVIALESTSKEVFIAITNRDISLKTIYQNLFTIDQTKLSSSLYTPLRITIEEPKAAGFIWFTLPFAVMGTVLTAAEQITRTQGIHWSRDPGLVPQHLHEALLLKLSQMELEWFHGDNFFDMKKVLAMKQDLKPRSDKAKQQQLAVYRSFSEHCKHHLEDWQKRLAHLTTAASLGIQAAQECLSDYHSTEVQQLSVSMLDAKTRNSSLQRLAQLQALGDKNAIAALQLYAKQRIDYLSRSDLTSKELQELKDFALDNKNAAVVLGRYYERLVKLGKNYKKEAIAAFQSADKTILGCYELGRCHCEGVLVSESLEKGFYYYFLAAQSGHQGAKQALENYLESLPNTYSHRRVFLIVLLEMLQKKDSSEFIKVIQTTPEVVAKILFHTFTTSSWAYDERFKIQVEAIYPLYQTFQEHCPDTAPSEKSLAKKHVLAHQTKQTDSQSSSSSSSSSPMPMDHEIFKIFFQDLQGQLKKIKYDGDIPENLCNLNGDIMENPWSCNDGNTYCLKSDLPKLLGHPSPTNRNITLKLNAPNHDVRKACLEFVESKVAAFDKVRTETVVHIPATIEEPTLSLPEAPKTELVELYPAVPNDSVDDDNESHMQMALLQKG